jgi:sortase (surface protein transpeptidase)
MTGARGGLAVAALALALLVGCSKAAGRQPEPDQAAGGAAAAHGFRSVRSYQGTPVPVRIDIPKIHVTSSLDRLGRAADGTVEVPSDWQVAGWYAPGPRPGDPGSAVILGHVDSKSGPAVFYRLRELDRGDEIRVARADGSTVRFIVERTQQYPKDRFPTDEVYYPTLTPALRLVTCGGAFDPTAGRYRSNIIVFATLRP